MLAVAAAPATALVVASPSLSRLDATAPRLALACRQRRALAPLRGGAGISANLSADFVLKTLAPLMGGLISVTMFMSPLPAVLQASKDRALGTLNLTPYPAQCGNCAAWLTYSIILQNPWIFVPNVIGLALGLFFTLTGWKLGSEAVKGTIVRSFVSYMSVIALGIVCAAKGVFSITAKDVIGRLGIGLLMIYYCAPLSTIAKVVASKDSSSIDPALTMVGVANGCFWGMYGLAISDIYVYGPNLVGAAIAAFTSITWLLFRKPA